MFNFFEGGSNPNAAYSYWFYPLFILTLVCICVMLTLLIKALYNIRKTINLIPRLGGQINLCRMVSHALAYILWIFSWIFGMFLTIFMGNNDSGQQPYYYVTWLVITLFAVASQVFFFLILWHLGTKDKVKPIQIIVSDCGQQERRETLDLTFSENEIQNYLSNVTKRDIQRTSQRKTIRDLDADIWAIYLSPSVVEGQPKLVQTDEFNYSESQTSDSEAQRSSAQTQTELILGDSTSSVNEESYEDGEDPNEPSLDRQEIKA